jgi:magnesium chelatase family protein
MDIQIEVPAVSYQDLSSMGKGESSADIRKRVVAARRIQQERFRQLKAVTCNAQMRSKEIQKYCHLAEGPQGLLKMAITELNFSARAYDRILKVARTIADLAAAEAITDEHISEAIQYRSLDRQWQS